ncbi:VQ motif-containing protein 25 [Elaeis guineensis]|uniref:VQ motif-containing protein 25 n=1 Tax=Elaeis guineensis var. tenera TaxID=51953 RepID=A0A6I9RUP0_ELAGV|nr:VQ motif-containing protein 25 [Elaeis guineensis]
MEEFMNSKERGALPPRPPTLAMHDNSHAITKLKPKIRIVHIFAPEIIKTDAANFRELVQRLTGKPTKRTGAKTKKKRIDGEAVPRCKRFEVVGSRQEHEDSGCREVVKREVGEENVERELWVESSSGYTGFLRDMGEMDHGLLQGLGDLPLLPLSSSHMDVIGEATVP